MICRTLSLVLVIFLLVTSFGFTGDSSFWWRIELSISVTGTYKFLKNKELFYGHYSFSGLWQGAMERDNGDYILYQGNDRILDINWIEEHNQEKFDQTKSVKPKLKLNYVLRRGGEIHFDFETFSFLVPFENHRKKFSLILPRSAENDSINQKIQYNKDVFSGTNRIKLPENRIYDEPSIQKKFEWSWKRKKGELSSTHSVGIKLKIKKIAKEDP